MRNVIGTIPGRLDRGTVGHPGKYTYVIAENEAESPWTPLHAERGCRPEDSAVTVMAALGPHQFYNQLSSTAEGVLGTMCDAMRYPGMVGQPNYCVVLAGEHMRTIAADGWSKSDIRKYVFENTTNTIAHLKRTGRLPGAIKPDGRDRDPAAGAEPGRHPGGGGGRSRRLVLVLHSGLGEPDVVGGGDHGDQREETMMAGFEILDPTVEPRRQPLTYVARPDSLKGKRIGLVENTKYNSDKLLLKIGDILKQEYGAAETRMWRKHNAGVPAHAEILEEAKRTVDVVVAGIGD